MHKYYIVTCSTENATPPKSTKSRNSNSLVQNQIKPKSPFEFVPRNTEKSEILDLVDFRSVAISVETVIHKWSISSAEVCVMIHIDTNDPLVQCEEDQ